MGHTSAIRGLSFAPDGETAVSCSSDCTVKLWKVPHAPLEVGEVESVSRPVMEYQGANAFRYGRSTLDPSPLDHLTPDLRSIDHHWGRTSFATAGAQVDVWDHERTVPIHSFTWGSDTVRV